MHAAAFLEGDIVGIKYSVARNIVNNHDAAVEAVKAAIESHATWSKVLADQLKAPTIAQERAAVLRHKAVELELQLAGIHAEIVASIEASTKDDDLLAQTRKQIADARQRVLAAELRVLKWAKNIEAAKLAVVERTVRMISIEQAKKELAEKLVSEKQVDPESAAKVADVLVRQTLNGTRTRAQLGEIVPNEQVDGMGNHKISALTEVKSMSVAVDPSIVK